MSETRCVNCNSKVTKPATFSNVTCQECIPKATYNGVLQTIIKNTGKNQPLGMKRFTLYSNRKRANYDLDQVRSAIQALKEQNEIIQWCDEKGKIRYGICNETTLVKLIEKQSKQDDPNRKFIAKANRLLKEVRNAGD